MSHTVRFPLQKTPHLLQASLPQKENGPQWPVGGCSWQPRWYLRYPLSYRNLEDMMRERGLHIDHTTIYRSRAMLRT
jgi:transposase-like protein